MKIKHILDGYRLAIVDLEVELNGTIRSAPTLCAISEDEVVPLNTPDGRPILMKKANSIARTAENGNP
ncbi:MAG: hypothetical protein ACO32I_07000 [Candidatus Limnocylindrus sp.]